MRQAPYLLLLFLFLPSASLSSPPVIQIPDIGEYEDHYDQDCRCDNDQEQKRGNIQIHGSVCSAVEDSLKEILDPVNNALIL